MSLIVKDYFYLPFWRYILSIQRLKAQKLRNIQSFYEHGVNVLYRFIHSKGSLKLEELIQNIKNQENFQKAGAIAIFIGVARGENPNGEIVHRLEIEAYEEKADEVLANICEDLKKREGIVDVQIHHFQGEFNVGEDLVYVLVAGVHRGNVFPVLVEAVERYKREAPIFKKEVVINGEGNVKAYWVAEKIHNESY